jgi:predicted dehydrogenase
MRDRYTIVGAADPSAERLEAIRKLSGNADFRGYASDTEILAEPKFADVMLVCTQDSMHIEHATAAIERGYDVMVEKPIGTDLREILGFEQRATELGRKVLVCHVLRYAAFYRKVKQIVDSGVLGDIVSVRMIEGVGAFHQAHSYVRGHWAKREESSPMLIAKSCHDLDILGWLVGRPCRQVSSFGSLKHFTEANAPEGAPLHCADGCPVGATCPYNSVRYTREARYWLPHIWPGYDPSQPASDEQVMQWINASPWGRCVYRCENDVVDHQVVNLVFEDEITASFTMTAFHHGRDLEIYGTAGRLSGGEAMKQATGADITVFNHFNAEQTQHKVDADAGGYDGHGGGDRGLMNVLYQEMAKAEARDLQTSIHASVESHIIGFAADESRVFSRTVDVDEFRQRLGSDIELAQFA